MLAPNQQYVYSRTLDSYLARGYYRMGRNFLTQNQIWYNEAYYNVYWLRYDLSKFYHLKSHKAIIKKAADFTIYVQALQIDETLHQLYNDYAGKMSFDTSESLVHYLYSYEPFYNNKPVVFNSKLVTILHQNTIIAAGIYDEGWQAIAGIINFYNTNYSKYSLGKLLVLAKMELAKERNMQYYYPGYIVPGIAKFDYKTFVGKHCIEVWDAASQQWIPYTNFFG